MNTRGFRGRVKLCVRRWGLVWGPLSAALLACTAQPGPYGEAPGEPQTVVDTTEALTTPVQGIYVVSVDASGGFCDAVAYPANHAAAIQACIDRANADGGGTVLVRAGSYTSGTWPLTLKSNVTLQGAAQLGTRFAPATAQIIGTMQDNSSVLGINLDLSSVTEGAVRLGAAAGAHSNLRFEGNQFLLANPSGLSSAYSVYAPLGANSFDHIVIRGNQFVTSGVPGATAVNVDLEVTSGQGTINFVRVEGNDFYIASGLPGVNAAYLRSQSSTVPSVGNVISGNTVRGTNTFAYAFYLAGMLDVLVTGNATQAVAAGVKLDRGAATSCGAFVIGNSFRSYGAPSIDSACLPNSIVTGNSANQASASTGKAAVLVHAYKNTNQDFTAGTPAPLTFNVVDFDNSASFTPSTGTFVAPAGGVYRVHACARFRNTNYAADDSADIYITVAGVNWALNRVSAGGNGSMTSCTEDLVKANSGDAINVMVNATGAANTRTINGTGRYSTSISIERVSD